MRDFSWGTISSSQQAQESLAGETQQDLPWGHCSPQPVSLGAAKGAVGSQPDSDFWRAPAATRMCRKRICKGDQAGAGQCLASPLLDVCWGWGENGSSYAAAQWPQSGSSRGTGRAGWDGSTSSDIWELGLSPCLLSQQLCPAPGPSQASLQGEKRH